LLPNERTALETFVDRLLDRYGEELLKVVLFGSKARGDFDDESDLDLLVVIKQQEDGYRTCWEGIVDIAWEIGLGYGIVISPLVKEDSSYEQMRHHPLLLARNIDRDGIELWTRQSNVPTSPST
jgi:predicted nucleotidyltransferase